MSIIVSLYLENGCINLETATIGDKEIHFNNYLL